MKVYNSNILNLFFNAVVAFSLILVSGSLFAQNETNHWVFGNAGGLDFSSGAPVAAGGGPILAEEGCSSISDADGNLLFYTNGTDVWNANDDVMLNGTGLLANNSSTQGVLIVPIPGSADLYYIFTVDDQQGDNNFELRYSIVDMTLDGGLGGISATKNELLYAPVTEKLNAVHHCNEEDIWLVTHERDTQNYLSFLITDAGVDLVPIVNTMASVHDGPGVGYLKFSPDGSRLASVRWFDNIIEVFGFNSTDGTFTSVISISSILKPYGVEFSPDVTKLYISTAPDDDIPEVVQFNLLAGDFNEVINSAVVVGAGLSGEKYGALQLGIDGKIYLAKRLSGDLGVINNPAGLGLACDYQDEEQNVGNLALLGLPNFVQSFFAGISTSASSDTFYVSNNCAELLTEFDLQSVNVDSVLWDFGDPASGADNISKIIDPEHEYSTTGTYEVKVIIYKACGVDSVEHTLQILEAPDVDLGTDMEICGLADNPVTLDAGNPTADILWSTDETTPTISVDTEGTYFVTVDNGVCIATDTIEVSNTTDVNVDLGADRSICSSEATSTTLNAGNPGADYEWSTTQEDQEITVDESGEYWVQVNIGLCEGADTININFIESPDVDLGADIESCISATPTITLDTGLPAFSHDWSTNETTSAITVSESGTYFVEVDNQGCTDSDEISVHFLADPELKLDPDTTLCLGETLTISPGVEEVDYLWSTGSTDPTITIVDSSLVELTITNECGSANDEMLVSFRDCFVPEECQMLISNAFSPNNDGVHDTFGINNVLCNVESADMKIYNRWGQLVFETSSIDTGWDGFFNNVLQPIGVYAYQLSFTNADTGNREMRTGNVTLIR